MSCDECLKRQWKTVISWRMVYEVLCLPRMMEADVTGVLGKFQVEHGIHGARVVARAHQLTTDCTADGEIDAAVQMLKDDLDTCANEMKRLVALNRRGSLFEGWPSAKDGILDA